MSLLRSLFGPSKEEIWRQVASQIRGRFIGGGFFSADVVQAEHGDWLLTLDTYSEGDSDSPTYTRLRAPYVNPEGFRFTIYRASIFSGLTRMIGLEDLEVGHARFDRDFVVKSNSPSRVRDLLANEVVRDLIEAQPKIHLSVKDDEGWFGERFPDGVDQLEFRALGVMKDRRQLHDLFDLFAAVLDHICHQGGAYEDDVQLHIQRLRGPGGTIGRKLVAGGGTNPAETRPRLSARPGTPGRSRPSLQC